MNSKNFFNSTVRFAIFILGFFVCWFLSKQFNFNIDQAKEFIGRFPLAISGIIFVFLYVSLTTLILVGPKDVLRIASALVWGPYYSTLFVFLGEMGNLVVLFHISRKLGRGFIEEKFKLRQKDVERVKKNSGSWGVFALRVNPFVPYRLLDICYGLSSIKFKKYFFICLIASPLRIFWLQSVIAGAGISILQNPDALLVYLQDNPTVMIYSLGYLGVVCVISLIALILKLVRR